MGLYEYWPLYNVVLSSKLISLRIVNDEDLESLVKRAREGIHDPETMPFGNPWTDLKTPELERSLLKAIWRERAESNPKSWRVSFSVIFDGDIIGLQSLSADDFSITRVVTTHSWLSQKFQNRGLGTEMRAIVLEFAFRGLKANEARSDSYLDNIASIKVSQKLGYVENGLKVWPRRNEPVTSQIFSIYKESWQKRSRDDISIQGIEDFTTFFEIAM